MKVRRACSIVIVSGGLFCLIFLLQSHLTNIKDSSWNQERMTFLPHTDKIKPFLFGFSSTYSNFIWIRTMIYFGTHYSGDRQFPWLIGMIDIVTKLNPYFYPAYEFAGTILPNFENNPDAARIILLRGMTYIGNQKYTIPFFLGWLYYKYYQDYSSAAQYLAIASQNPNVPRYIIQLTATFYKNAGKTDLGLAFLATAYQSSENPKVKSAILQKIKDLQSVDPTSTQQHKP